MFVNKSKLWKDKTDTSTVMHRFNCIEFGFTQSELLIHNLCIYEY